MYLRLLTGMQYIAYSLLLEWLAPDMNFWNAQIISAMTAFTGSTIFYLCWMMKLAELVNNNSGWSKMTGSDISRSSWISVNPYFPVMTQDSGVSFSKVQMCVFYNHSSFNMYRVEFVVDTNKVMLVYRKGIYTYITKEDFYGAGE